MWINIAAAKKPNNTEGFFKAIQEAYPSITAGVIATGQGCNNFGFIIDAPEYEAEMIANQLTMALMPSRWSECQDDPMLKPGQFYDAREI